MSWNKTRFSHWEVEGEVRKRVETALAQAERDRLASQSRSEREGYVARRLLSFLGMGLDWVAGCCRASLDVVRESMGAPRGLEEGGDGAQESG